MKKDKKMTYLEKITAIVETKQTFEKIFERELGLIKVGAPLFVRTDTGLQDDLSGTEKGDGCYVAENIQKFDCDGKEMARILIDNGYGDIVLKYLEKFGLKKEK